MSLRQTFLDILEDNIEGMSKKEAEYYIENDAIPESGSVSGLIMYAETEEIGAKYHSELMQIIKDNFGEMDECPSLNDLVWIAWSAMLEEIKEEALKSVRTEIEVPRSVIVAFSEASSGISVDLSMYVDYVNESRVGVDTDVAIDMEEFVAELKAYVFYKVDETEDMNVIESVCEKIEEAYDNDEDYVDLVA